VIHSCGCELKMPVKRIYPEDLSVIVCRPALPQDTPDVIELTRTIWEGRDYVPRAWHDWLADYNGLLAAAEYGGRVVGVAKLTNMGDDEWWLQGLRVHPQHQGRGVASHLHDYVLAWWERHAGGVLRLATSSERVQVHHLCARTGFDKIGELVQYAAPALNAGEISWQPVHSEQVGEAHAFVVESPLTAIMSGLMDLGWVWVTATAARLAELAAAGQVYWWRDKGTPRGVVSWLEDEGQAGKYARLQLVACDLEALDKLLVAVRRLVGAHGLERVVWIVPEEDQLFSILERAGFLLDWDHPLFLFQKTKPMG